MKKIYFLIAVYIGSLALSIFGYVMDSDPITNSFAYQIFEIFMMSIFVFGILMLPAYILYSAYLFLKRIAKRKLLIK